MKYSFVTVVFDAEFLLLELQARSMQKYVPREMVDEIFIIANRGNEALIQKLESIRHLYGELAERVQIINSTELDDVPTSQGWVSQQVLKLLISNLIESDRYIVLDAKTHFISQLNADFVESLDGRALITAYPYVNHSLRPRLERTLKYFGFEPSEHIGFFPTSVPPFVIYTHMARSLIEFVTASSNKTFSELFVSQGLTEFFLYSAWIIRCDGSMKKKYEIHERHSPVIWEHQVSLAAMRAEIARGANGISPLLSVHRRAFPKMKTEGLSFLSSLWKENGLFKSQRDAEKFIFRYRRAILMPFLVETLKRKVLKKIKRGKASA